MKKLLLIGALVLAGLAAPALAGESKSQKNWGTQVGGSGSPTVKIFELNSLAGQESDAAKGILSGSPTYNTYYNQACGVCTNIDINGSGNNVSTDGKNTGNVGAQQGIGNGGIKQGIQQ